MFDTFKCKAFTAAVAFALLSMVASAVNLWQAKPTDYPYHSWTSWAIDDFLAQQQSPDLVFMGSSLMLVPLAGVDADYYNKKRDGAEHHHSEYFEQALLNKTGTPVKTYNFALPGEMPSDAYLITKLVTKEKRPNVIVYGIGPRDFMDNLLPNASSTDPFHFLERFVDIAPIAQLAMPGWTERFNYELGKANYFYGGKIDLCTQFNKLASAELNKVLPKPAELMPRQLVHKLMPDHKPFELEKKDAYFRPLTDLELASFVDNLEEYRKRYKHLNTKTFLTQFQFLVKSVEEARSRGVHVVIVAMPITDLNRELIPDQAWNLYRNSVKTVATACGASFVDFSESACFNRKDFSDTVHLHARGGRKFLDLLIEQMCDDQRLMAALRKPNQVELAGKERGQL
jgi:hypothetical protein